MTWCLWISGILLLAIAAGCRVAAFEGSTNDDETEANSEPTDQTRQSGRCVCVTVSIEGTALQNQAEKHGEPDERNKADPGAGPESEAVAA